MKSQFSILLLLALLCITGCSSEGGYKPNEQAPENVRESFYVKSVEVMNFYIEKAESKILYTDEFNDYLLEYYRFTPSSTEEEIKIKASLTFIDLLYQSIESYSSVESGTLVNSELVDFYEQLEELKGLLELED